ncbi:hypothetical protein [Alkalicoccus halolimnae]|uniref:Uncharacterized protein n=1 Tax=Alkalicoccus halolimnae TaxID=1667239 RepID=A0A5C7F4X1_9BACI|nr:hypothetical protein [Alkalicoccus halolimnae]TXF85632.1 hypothetical protein FTX54_08565 [Alkalicoccus halolimnae]
MDKTMKQLLYAVQNKEGAAPHLEIKEDIYRDGEGEMVIFLSVSDKMTRAHVVTGKGKTFQEAAEKALKVFHRNISPAFQSEYVKLDIVKTMKTPQVIHMNKHKLFYKRREDGFLLDGMWEAAFLPEEVEAYQLIEEKQLRRERMFRPAEKHFQLHNGKLGHLFTGKEKVEFSFFRTISYFIDETGTMPLFRGHRLYSELTEDILEYAVKLSRDNYFQHVVNEEGKFLYSYDPAAGRAAEAYNILRHAGTVYSMLETYERFPEQNLLQEIKRALNYLVSKTESISNAKKKMKVIVEKDNVKLGGNGLALVALAKYTDVTGDEQYLSLMQEMGEWMLSIQEENGNFGLHKQKFSTGEIYDFSSYYYPGEAMLGLTRLYDLDPQEKWLDACEGQAGYIIHQRDKNVTEETVEHDHWLLYALYDLHTERENKDYLDHALFVAGAIVKTQREKEAGHDPEWPGSYEMKGIPRSTPTACRSEGLGAAVRLAEDNGLYKEAAVYYEAMKKGILFQLQMQLRPESVMYYDYKQLCTGALHESLVSYELRNDYTQHNVSSFLSCCELMKNRK